MDTSPSTLRDSRDATSRGEFDGGVDNYITFLHPGYEDRSKQSVLLRLEAYDRDGGGLHFGTALVACRMVAGNSTSGFFTQCRDGPRVELEFDELLRKTQYYFYNPEVEDRMYPVYRSFADWSFPHDNVPVEWSDIHAKDVEKEPAPPAASGLTAFISARDKCCRVSEAYGSDYFDRAHLIPRSELDWFEANGMSAYNLSRQLSRNWLIDDARNAIALRSDLHSAFDDYKFVIIPKQSKWVVHFTGPTNRLGEHFHNTSISLIGVSCEFLYARFAWTVFRLLSASFLTVRISRRLTIRLPDGQEVSKMLAFDEIKENPPRSRSTSPKKRQMAISEADYSTKRIKMRHDELSISAGSSVDTEPVFPETPVTNALSAHQANEWRRSHRPSDPSKYCCDYRVAEEVTEAGLPGKPEHNGRYVCDTCLGAEYTEDRDKDVEDISLVWED